MEYQVAVDSTPNNPDAAYVFGQWEAYNTAAAEDIRHEVLNLFLRGNRPFAEVLGYWVLSLIPPLP